MRQDTMTVEDARKYPGSIRIMVLENGQRTESYLCLHGSIPDMEDSTVEAMIEAVELKHERHKSRMGLAATEQYWELKP